MAARNVQRVTSRRYLSVRDSIRLYEMQRIRLETLVSKLDSCFSQNFYYLYFRVSTSINENSL